MRQKRILVSTEDATSYTTVHPALDFLDHTAILSIGGKWIHTFSDGDVDFASKPLCVTVINEDGLPTKAETFPYSKRELANRRFFHSGYLDIPSARWCCTDIESFCKEPVSNGFPEVFSELEGIFGHYIDFIDKRLYTLFPIFVIYTYFYPLFSQAPVIQLWGEFKTGKTKIVSLLDALAFNPVNSANISSSSVFRLIESRRAVILLDESEDLMTSERARDIRNMLLAGTGKSGETYRQEKTWDESFRTQSFKVFSPKVIANIAGIDLPALQSRTIRVTTLGTKNKEMANREVDLDNEKWQFYRAMLYRLCLCRFQDVLDAKKELPEHNLSGRTFGIWQGMLTVASLVGIKQWNHLLSYASDNKTHIEAETEEDLDKPRKLISLLAELIKERGDGDYTVDSVLKYLSASDVYVRSKKELSMMLGRIGVLSTVKRREEKTIRCYELRKAFIDALAEHR